MTIGADVGGNLFVLNVCFWREPFVNDGKIIGMYTCSDTLTLRASVIFTVNFITFSDPFPRDGAASQSRIDGVPCIIPVRGSTVIPLLCESPRTIRKTYLKHCLKVRQRITDIEYLQTKKIVVVIFHQTWWYVLVCQTQTESQLVLLVPSVTGFHFFHSQSLDELVQ